MQIGSNSTALLNLSNNQNSAENTISKIASMHESALSDSASATINHALQNQFGTLTQGVSNANNAVSMMQIADGTLQSLSKNSDHLNELSVAMNNAALGANGRSALESEFNATVKSMSQSIESTTFNSQRLFGASHEFSLGNSNSSVSLNSMDLSALDINNPESITAVQDQISANLIEVGSATNGFKSAINSNLEAITNLSAASSQLSDVDVGQAINDLNRDNLLTQSGIFAQVQQTQSLQASMDRLLG